MKKNKNFISEKSCPASGSSGSTFAWQYSRQHKSGADVLQ